MYDLTLDFSGDIIRTMMKIIIKPPSIIFTKCVAVLLRLLGLYLSCFRKNRLNSQYLKEILCIYPFLKDSCIDVWDKDVIFIPVTMIMRGCASAHPAKYQ